MKIAALVLAIVGGLAVGTQPLLNGALGRTRGVLEAVFVSITVSFAAVVLLLAAQTARGSPLGLPFSIRSAIALAGAVLLAALTLALVGRAIAPWYFTAGLLGLVVLVAGTVATPILGVGVTTAALTAGQLGIAIVWDQIGVLGLPEVPISPQRVLGILLVIVGVVLIRGL
ncbi:MAG TPA: DMT family transporter [Chloroflexota bacterium]|jgi:transporter family-2 protein|nr:DMT family transporter [Chloroflexota bacterium]